MNFDQAIVSAALRTSRITPCGLDLAFDSSSSHTTCNVTYLEKTANTFKCLLCNVADMSRQDLTGRHVYSDKHTGSLMNLYDDIERVEIASERFCRLFSKPVYQTIVLLDQMTEPSWRDSIESEMFRYLVADNSRTATEEIEALERPLRKLRMFEHSERLVLLRLAVWKAECLLQLPEMTCGNMVLAVMEWGKEGWKSVKEERRLSNAMNIVVSQSAHISNGVQSICWPISSTACGFTRYDSLCGPLVNHTWCSVAFIYYRTMYSRCRLIQSTFDNTVTLESAEQAQSELSSDRGVMKSHSLTASNDILFVLAAYFNPLCVPFSLSCFRHTVFACTLDVPAC
jgi:hypothetical protein